MDTVAASETKARELPGIERRRSPREPIYTSGVVYPVQADTAAHQRQVMVSNVSRHGVGFCSTTPFNLDDTCGIRIGAGPLHLTSRFRIISCRLRPDGMYDVGGEFF